MTETSLNRILRRSGFVFASFLIILVTFSIATAAPRRQEKVASTKNSPNQNADLPYRYSIDGFDVEISSAELTPTAVAWDQSVQETIGEDERWLGVDVSVTETQGRERQFPWIMMVRLKTALDEIVNAPHVLSAREVAVSAEQEKLNPHEREEMRFFFRVKRGDFPVTLVFADGGAAPLGQ